jgi:hyaluronate lyase
MSMISHQPPKALASIASSFLKWSPRTCSFFHLVCIGSVAFFFSAHRGVAATYTVNNATDFNNLPQLRAGDVVKMNSGTYGAINKTLESLISDDTTAKDNPVLVYAVTPGGVVVNAPSKITLSGRGIILAGLDFNANSGILADYLVGTAPGSRYMTLSHLRFNGCAAGATDGKWIYIQGFYATIEYCTLTERPDTIRNATVAFMPNLSEGGVAEPRLHKVRYCYFGPRYAVPQDTSSDADNGFESLRIGVGDAQTFDMQVTVERNVFYRSIWRTDGAAAGEPEIISIKSKGNKILNNTILESQGGICLRTGQYCTVEGNFIFGAGYYSGNSIATGTARTLQGGIRVIGKNQIVRNNYIFNVLGTDARAALCVMSGESNYDEGDPATGRPNSGSYLPADNAQIYNNTFINCAEINLGYLSPDSYAAPASPTGVKFYNNVWQGNGSASSALVRDTTSVTGYTPITLGGSGGNYIYETSSGKIGWRGPVGTYTTSSNPAISETSGNYKIPTSTSPLLGLADATLSAATDIRGFDRPTTARDIGCYERDANGTTAYAPMLRNEVGAVFDGGPAVPSYYPTVSLYESFESYTIGNAIPAVALPATTGIKASGQVTAASGGSLLGSGTKVAWLNDIISAAGGSGQLELNAFDAAQSTLSISFDIANNATASGTGTQPLNIGLLAWNTAVATAGGSTAKRICGVTFNQDGSLTTPGFSVQGGSGGSTVYTGTYDRTKKQTVNFYANDQNANSVNYLGPDGVYRTLAANSFSVFLNQVFVGAYAFNTVATDNSGTLLIGNSNLGRIGFNTSTTNLGNWLIDNVSMSTMPTGVVIPVVTKPTFTSPNTASGQAGTNFNYTPTYTGTAPTICSITGTLPIGLSFNSASGAISGASNQSGSFAVTITATNSAGSDSITLTMTFTPAPPNIFSGSNPSLNTDTSWSLGYPPTVSTSGGSYTDLGFISSATSLTTTSGNINGKSYNVTNGLGYVFSSVRDSTGTIYKIGDTGSTNTSLFTNTITGVTNQLAYLANNSSITFSRLSPINNIPPVLQLRNSGSLRVETGSTLDIQTDVTQPSVTSGYGWTKIGGGTLKLSGSNSYTGASIVQDGTLALAGQGLSAVTIKTNAILEIALTSPGTATFNNTAAVSLEAGSKVRVTGTPADGAIYTLVSASSLTSLATLESSVSGYQLAVLNNSLQLQPVGAPTFSSSSFTATGAANSGFTYQIVASGSPTSYGAIGLPSWASFDTLTGTITGTPTVGGTFSVTISATNAVGTGSTTLTLNFSDEFDALRLKWRTTLIDDVKSSKTLDSINSRSSGYQTTMLYSLTGVKVVNGGSDYTSVPTVVVSGGGGTGATATAAIAAGKVSAITVTSLGSGYTTTPTITVSGGGGNGVSAIPIVAIWSDLPPAAQTGVSADVASGNIADSFKRLEYMAQAYAIPECALYQNASLLAAITGGLDWLTSNVYTSTGTDFGNWYDWEIAGPQSLNNAAILLLSNPSALTSTQIANYVGAVYNYGPNSVNFKDNFWWGALTGANTSNVALTTAVQGILLGNNTTTVTRFWHNTAGHPVNPQTDYLVSGSLLLEEAQGNLSGNNPLDSSGDSVFTPVTSGDGWYADGSFIFHGNIPYTGSYGQELTENIAILVKLLDGSTWEITDPDLSSIYGWITEGTMPLMYRGAMMDMVRGRAIASSSSDESKVGAAALKTMRSVATFAPADIAAELLAFADSPQVAPGQYHFASMDRVAAHRNGFSFGLSMSSTRVGGYEINTTSPTNLKGWYTGAGVTYLYLGNPDTQYMDDYWATIDWYHLPGTTADLSPLSVRPQDAVTGETDQNWVGGAQVDKTYGVAGMSAHPNGTQLYAKKSWFMLDDEVVCLGAGITSTSGGEVDTTVENRKLKATGATAFHIADTAYSLVAPTTWAIPETVSTGTSPTWCALEGVAGYYFPEGGSNLQAQFTSDSGSWKTINPTDSDTNNYTDYYLKLLFKHGASPTNAKYAYVILPNRTVSSVKGYAYNPDIRILSNTEPTGTTTGVQAVKSEILGVVAANFWAKTSGSDTGGTADFIAVNKQCSVIVKETYNTLSVGVADPTQSNTGAITVTLNGRASIATLSADSGVTVTGNNPITLSVNVNGSKGKSFNASFSTSPAPVITSNLNMVGVIGSPLSYQIASDASGVTYGATGLPQGLNLNTATGLITGTPTESGTYNTTLSATNGSGRTGYATLTIQVGANLSNLSSTFGASTTWVCPANVTAVQVECWGAGGAGGSAYKPVSGNAFGGGGAGGAYAKKNSVSVVPGTSYTISIGEGGVSAISPSLTTVSGGDSWFGSGSATYCLAKGGSGGQSVISSGSGIVGSGGVGSSADSVGDLFFAGGNGLAGQGSPINTGGGGGGSGTTLSVGGSATSYLGATGVSGGGAGGNGKDSSGNGNGSQGGSPGGGGGGARGSSVGSQTLGGTGGAGQVVLTVVGMAKVPQTITFGLDPATAKVGDLPRTLIASASSGLPVTLTSSDSGVATITSGNTLNIVGEGTATLTATQTGDGNYEAAMPVSVILTVSPGGTTFANWSGNAAVTSDLVSRYAFGALSMSSASEKITSSITATTLSLTAVVRTDDPKLVITPKSVSSLSGTWSATDPVISVVNAADQTGLGTGLVRKVYSVERGIDSKRFLKLEAVYTP